MTALMKAEACHSVHRFSDGGPPGRDVVPARSAEAARMDAMRGEIEALEKQLADARAAATRAEAKAREEGRRDGQAAALQDDGKRLVVLSEGVSAACAAWNDRIGGIDGLAAAVARSAMAKLFHGCDDHGDFVVGMIARQMGHLRREAVLSIRVSAEDFPDAPSLVELASRAATGPVEIVRDGDLATGQCRIDLQLGHLDLCSRSQWDELALLLQELGSEDVAA